MNDRELTNEDRDAFIKSLGLSYSARFVPQSQSSNKDEKRPTLNWHVTVGAGTHAQIETDYMQGAAHLPGYRMADTSLTYAEYVQRVCETGRYSKNKRGEENTHGIGWAAIPAPLLRDVLYSLASDADALDSPTYEDWASSYGYDADSRKGEAIYRQCVEIGLKLRAMIGEEKLRQLREVFQDY